MKITDILITETFDFDVDQDRGDVNGNILAKAPTISVADLNTLQVRTLERLKNGEVTIDTASEKEFEIIQDLIELGVVDDDGNVVAQDSGEDESTYRTSDTSEYDDIEGLDSSVDDEEVDDPDEINFNI